MMKSEYFAVVTVAVIATVLAMGFTSTIYGQANMTAGNMTAGNMTAGNAGTTSGDNGGDNGDDNGDDGGDGDNDGGGSD